MVWPIIESSTLQLSCSIDASFNVHPDASLSCTGAAIFIGESHVYVKCSNQWLISRYSTEAELNAVYDTSPQILWLQQLIHEVAGHEPSTKAPAIVCQDNQSTLMEKGQFFLDCTII